MPHIFARVENVRQLSKACHSQVRKEGGRTCSQITGFDHDDRGLNPFLLHSRIHTGVSGSTFRFLRGTQHQVRQPGIAEYVWRKYTFIYAAYSNLLYSSTRCNKIPRRPTYHTRGGSTYMFASGLHGTAVGQDTTAVCSTFICSWHIAFVCGRKVPQYTCSNS